ncbi:hypothetical protein J437_LFUL004741 [Ladona fulva]|uniref:Ig-like domain-containing protein n=1 Tax=Ladona fulva TaxID=123851 RepID=A0A8K0K1K0_LADFU|nr:hypothetical protein J437_LFUL004741 [Ladona fulva]
MNKPCGMYEFHVIGRIPPDILDYPTSTDMVVREGTNVTLRCAATGSPRPSIVWRREDGESIPVAGNTEGEWRRWDNSSRLNSDWGLMVEQLLNLEALNGKQSTTLHNGFGHNSNETIEERGYIFKRLRRSKTPKDGVEYLAEPLEVFPKERLT